MRGHCDTPAWLIILLLPAGFTAGALTTVVNPDKIFGAAWPPLVSLAIAAIMLGAILIVSGRTVVTPILHAARTGKRVTTILGFEGTTIDPIGIVLANLRGVDPPGRRGGGHGAVQPNQERADLHRSHGAAGDRRGIHGRELFRSLVALHIGGADKLLPATFLVIVGTVAIYGLTAAPLARALGLREPGPGETPAEQPPKPTRSTRRTPPATVRSPGKDDAFERLRRQHRVVRELRAAITPVSACWAQLTATI